MADTKPRRRRIDDPQLQRLSLLVDTMTAMSASERAFAFEFLIHRFNADTGEVVDGPPDAAA
jgi:hypothetical protein